MKNISEVLQKKKKKSSKISLASGWKNACQAKNSLTASSQPITSIHDTFYVGRGLCFLDATSVSEATVTWCIMRIIFRCICVPTCLEARVTTCQKKESPLFFPPLMAAGIPSAAVSGSSSRFGVE